MKFKQLPIFSMKNILLFFSLVLLSSCGDSSPKCAYGSPTPIFSKDLEKVSTHHFTVNGQDASETIEFSNGLFLEILQGGCNSVRQEFRFLIPGESKEDVPAYWVAMAIDLFHLLGDISEKYLVYHQYGKALEEKGNNIKLGESFELGEGFGIKVDRIAGTNQNILIVELSQGREE